MRPFSTIQGYTVREKKSPPIRYFGTVSRSIHQNRKMKYFLFVLYLLMFNYLHGQFKDDFSDGDLTVNPPWQGDLPHFKTSTSTAIPAQIKPGLQLDASEAGNSQIFTAITISEEVEWRFWIKLSFNTSSNNYARVILISDSFPVALDQSSYFLQFGGIDDSLYLFREKDGLSELLMTGKSLFTGNGTNDFFVKVIYKDHSWSVYSDQSGGGIYYDEGLVPDTMAIEEGYFGLSINYTGSNITKFYFDELEIMKFEKDTIPPRVSEIAVTGQSDLELVFSEAVDTNSATNPANYSLSGSNTVPDSIYTKPGHASRITLRFANPFVSGGNFSLKITAVGDLSGNLLNDTVVGFSYYEPLPYDIVVCEIMADPSPSVGLPEAEYLELLNTSQYEIDLSGWNLWIGSSQKALTGRIAPGEYIIICHENMGHWLTQYGQLLTFGSFSLSNSGQSLKITDKYDRIVCFLKYDDSWYGEPEKKDGGWSLEQIDPMNPCLGKENWAASVSLTGGTPGEENSTNAVNILTPEAIHCCVLNSKMLEVFFNNKMDSLSMLNADNYSVDKGVGSPAEVYPVRPAFQSTVLEFDQGLENGVEYVLEVKDVSNCKRNGANDASLHFGLPVKAEKYDLVINEILFNPIGDGVDYVEIYNRSGAYIELENVFLESIRNNPPALPDTTSIKITSSCLLIHPDQYLVLTPDADKVCNQYHCRSSSSFVEMSSFPSFANEEGIVILRSSGGETIDIMEYSDDMHFAMLVSSEGVSLEKTHYELPGRDANNWQSASSGSGYGTPGYENSQFTEIGTNNPEISVHPEVITPDGDGRGDVAIVSWSFKEGGWAGNLTVHNSAGQPVRVLTNNVTLGTSGHVTWNGTDDRGALMPSGVFIILMNMYHPSGTTKRLAVSCGLVR